MAAYTTLAELRAFMDLPSGETTNDADCSGPWTPGAPGSTGSPGAPSASPPPPRPGCGRPATTDVVPLVDLQTAAPTVAVDTAGDRTYSTTLVAAQYALEPLPGPPFDTLRAWPTPAGGDAAPDPVVFEPGQLVRVTGVYGYTDATGGTPAEVEQANLLLGARWFKRREAPFSVLQVPELDALQTVVPPGRRRGQPPLPPLPAGVSRRRADGLSADGRRGPVRRRLGDGQMERMRCPSPCAWRAPTSWSGRC